MMRQIVNVNWKYIGDAVPAFVTVMFIPFGYSAAYGLIAGLLTYTTLNGLIYLTKVVSRGLIVPDDEDNREYWTGEFSAYINPSIDRFEANAIQAKPHGKLPWFFTASQAVAARFGYERHSKHENASIRSTSSQERFRTSKGSTRELDTVVVMPRDPRDEKVLRKI